MICPGTICAPFLPRWYKLTIMYMSAHLRRRHSPFREGSASPPADADSGNIRDVITNMLVGCLPDFRVRSELEKAASPRGLPPARTQAKVYISVNLSQLRLPSCRWVPIDSFPLDALMQDLPNVRNSHLRVCDYGGFITSLDHSPVLASSPRRYRGPGTRPPRTGPLQQLIDTTKKHSRSMFAPRAPTFEAGE